MIKLTFKNRSSDAYKFTTTDANCPEVLELKETVKERNAQIRERMMRFNPNKKFIKQYRIRIRPRGPRNGNYHDTPKANATHFDIYCDQYERRTYAYQKFCDKAFASLLMVQKEYGHNSEVARAALREYRDAVDNY